MTFATAVLSFGAFGALAVVSSMTVLAELDRETSLAANAARRAVETARATTAFPVTFASFNADPADDPQAPGSAPGRNFAVRGLRVQASDGDGFAGEFRFPSIVAGGVEELREDAVDAALGMPRDLNGDGQVDSLDHASDYVLLPLSVRIRWTGVGGDRMFQLHTMLSEQSP